MVRVIWRFSDGKAGHDHQSQGLIAALERYQALEVVTLPPLPATAALKAGLWGRWADWMALPAPDLLIGAGHRTHLSLLAARRCRGGKTVVLMRPSVPLALFDLCLIPEHDTPPVRANVRVTRGALNHLRPSTALEPWRGLLLIGGPSAHFDWDAAGLYRQIAAILAATPHMSWTLTNSRRTPAGFLAGLSAASKERLTLMPLAETGANWLPQQLAQSGQVWVTADSVSMVYEALTVGAAVGVLHVPGNQTSRIAQGIDRLAAQGWVTRFADWRPGIELTRPPGVFDEADRCACWISQQWFA